MKGGKPFIFDCNLMAEPLLGPSIGPFQCFQKQEKRHALAIGLRALGDAAIIVQIRAHNLSLIHS